MTYDPMQVRQAILTHARRAHDGTITLNECGALLRRLAEDAELYADPIAPAMIECAAAMEGGDFCTVIIPELQAVVAVDDGAVPTWKQDPERPMFVHLEADARVLQARHEVEERARFPGFPKQRPE